MNQNAEPTQAAPTFVPFSEIPIGGRFEFQDRKWTKRLPFVASEDGNSKLTAIHANAMVIPLPPPQPPISASAERKPISLLVYPPFMEIRQELCAWLDTQHIDSDNIGNIRRSLFVPWDSLWNGIVRDETATREKSPTPSKPDAPPAETPEGEKWRPRFKVGDRVRDKQSQRVGEIVELDHEEHRYLSLTSPSEYSRWCKEHDLEPAPWTLPLPPEGIKWHREDGWQKEWLEDGWRPLLMGEQIDRDCKDQILRLASRMWESADTCAGHTATFGHAHLRTRRPLPLPTPTPKPDEEGRKEQCGKCGRMVSDWLDPEWSKGRICHSCYNLLNPDKGEMPKPAADSAGEAAHIAACKVMGPRMIAKWNDLDEDDKAGFEAAAQAAIAWDKQHSPHGEVPTRDQLIDLINRHFVDVYHRTRVWSAWSVGTMGQDDFTAASESDLAGEIADAILSALPSPESHASLLLENEGLKREVADLWKNWEINNTACQQEAQNHHETWKKLTAAEQERDALRATIERVIQAVGVNAITSAPSAS